jgi:predicted nuclease with RNAse H fold
MGIDVSLVRRLDVVVLSEGGLIEYGPMKADTAELSRVLRDAKPDVVAIDSPPQWGKNGKSRLIETHLRKLGINVYSCPEDPGNHPFYRWMREGFRVFEAVAAEGFSLYCGRRTEVVRIASSTNGARCVPRRRSIPLRVVSVVGTGPIHG